MYGAAGLLFFVIGGIYALFMRLQLSRPGNSILSAETYKPSFHYAWRCYGLFLLQFL